MANSYIKDFRKAFNFLEDFGFYLTKDPEDRKYPCYKNAYGEIGLRIRYEGNSSRSILYVQMNGIKREIDVYREYKMTISRNTFLKSFPQMIKELFIKHVTTNNRFYDLPVKPKHKNKFKNDELHTFSNDCINLLKVAKKERLRNCLLLTSISFFIICVFIIAFYNYIATPIVMLVLKNIITAFILFISFCILVAFKHNFHLISKVLILLLPIIMTVSINFLSLKNGMALYLFLVILTILNLLIFIVMYVLKKDKTYLLDGIIPILTPSFVLLIKSFDMRNYIYTNEAFNDELLIIGGIAAFIGLVLYLVLKKDRTDKKEFIGGMFAAIFGAFFMIFIIPYSAISTVNYTFDGSEGIINEYLVIEKEVRHSGKGGPNHHIFVQDNFGEIIDLSVNAIIYETHDEGEYITLSLHEGFLGYEYLEYDENQ